MSSSPARAPEIEALLEQRTDPPGPGFSPHAQATATRLLRDTAEGRTPADADVIRERSDRAED